MLGRHTTAAKGDVASGSNNPGEAPPSSSMQHSTNMLSVSTSTAGTEAVDNKEPAVTSTTSSPLPWGLRYRDEEIKGHGELVHRLLAQVDSPATSSHVGHDFRSKLHRGILGAHWEQWAPLRQLYGDDALIRAFSLHRKAVSLLPALHVCEGGLIDADTDRSTITDGILAFSA